MTSLPILPSSNVSAVTLYDNSNPETFDSQIQAVLYYNAISYCFKNNVSLSGQDRIGSSEYITNSNATNDGKWFKLNSFEANNPTGRSVTTSIGIYMKNITDKNGQIDCSSPSLINGAMGAWGLNAIDVLCNSGFQRAGLDVSGKDDAGKISACKSNSSYNIEKVSGADNYKLFTDYVKKTALGVNDSAYPWMTDAQMYQYYIQTLQNSCIPSISMVNTPPGDTPNKSNNRQGYNDVNWYNQATNTVMHGSYAGIDNGNLFYIRNQNGSDFSSDEATCRVIAGAISDSNGNNKYALAYQKAWSDYAAKDTDEANATLEKLNSIQQSQQTSGSSCGIPGVGWIVCPVVTFLGSMSTVVFNFLANNLLVTKTNLVSTDSATYSAWQVMRNFANVAFVIVFMVIIFSQITSYGIDNYGIKKMLPRLVIAAILVNVSFFICQIAVDLSNILGYSLNNLFSNTRQLINIPQDNGTTFTGIDITAITANALLGTGAVVVGGVALLLSITVPVLLAVLAAVLMTVLILVARTSLIVLLIVISPLAFVAYVLPKTTDKLFGKWYKMFQGLLLVFPIVSLLFGAGNLAAYIISVSNPHDEVMQLFALGIAVVPLFAVPMVLKGSLNSIDGIGKTLSSWSDKANGRIGGKVRDTSRAGQIMKYRKSNAEKNRALINSGQYKGRNVFSRGVSSLNNRLNNYIPHGSEMSAAGITLADKLDEEAVTNRMTAIKNIADAGDLKTLQFNLRNAMKNDDSVEARANARVLAGAGGAGKTALHEALDKFQKDGINVEAGGNLIRKTILNIGLKGDDAALDKFGAKGGLLEELNTNHETFAKLSAGMLATQSIEVLTEAEKAGAISSQSAIELLNNSGASKDLSTEKRALLDKISKANIVFTEETPPERQSDQKPFDSAHK